MRRLRRAAAIIVFVLMLAVAPATAYGAQDDADPTPTAVAGDEAEASDDGSDEEPISNLGVLLFGSVLLAGGIWAYQNRHKRGYRY